MVPMDDVRGRLNGPILFATGDVLRMMLDSEHALDASGHASYYGARDPAKHRARYFRATVKAVDQAAGHAVGGGGTDRCRHYRGGSASEQKYVFHREDYPLLFKWGTQSIEKGPQRDPNEELRNLRIASVSPSRSRHPATSLAAGVEGLATALCWFPSGQ